MKLYLIMIMCTGAGDDCADQQAYVVDTLNNDIPADVRSCHERRDSGNGWALRNTMQGSVELVCWTPKDLEKHGF